MLPQDCCNVALQMSHAVSVSIPKSGLWAFSLSTASSVLEVKDFALSLSLVLQGGIADSHREREKSGQMHPFLSRIIES